MDVRAAVDFIEGAQRYSKKVGLSNMHQLLALLGDPQRDQRYVHVAGTNGKGSTCAMIASVLMAAGYRVGLYTSPYLQHFLERFRIGGLPLSEAEFLAAFGPVRDAVLVLRERGVYCTFFEIGTAVALLAFRRAAVDFAVIEVGIGGQNDPTNVILPMVCAICAIGLDHTNVLGDTLPEIAAKKAGIAKAGVPLVLHAAPPDVTQVVRDACREAGAPLTVLGGEEATPHLEDETGQTVDFTLEDLRLPDLRIGLAGAFQRGNAAVALGVIKRLTEAGVVLPREAIYRGMADVRWPGRLEWWPGSPPLLLDGAHNPQGLRALWDDVSGRFPGRRKVLLCGLLKKKKNDDMIRLLAATAPLAVCTVPPGEAAWPAAELGEALSDQGIETMARPELSAALACARQWAGPEGLVIVTGSLYLVGAVRTLLEEEV